MTPREKRVVIGGAVVVALTLAAVAVPRLMSPGAADAAEALEAERLARLRGLAASLDTLRPHARLAAQAEQRLASRYLQSGTPQVAAAEVSTRVRDIAEASQVEILREGVLPPRDLGRALEVSLQVVARSDLAGTLELLAALERSPVLLVVDDLSISGDPRDAPGVASLTLTFRVSGFLLSGGEGERQ